MNHQYQSLVAKLKEIFQINRPDLDFGIYRILNARRDEIGDFLDKRLKSKVQTALGEAKTKLDQTAIADLQKEIRDEFGRRAFDEQNQLVDEDALASDLGQKYLALTQQDAKAQDDETQVYNHLLTFFSRYYDEGDFISQRRYKGDTYSIPYAGEEVMLHWANKDQYYTKSGEMFSNYRFRLDDGKSVLFRLISADTARENRKDNDKDRRFVIVTEARTVTRVDDEGEEYEETIEPFSIVDGELTILFEYKAFTAKTKQEELNKQSAEKILSASVLGADWLAGLMKLEPTDKDAKRTLLDKHLSSYTQKHTADYFIHKDLGGFLSRELDFFIKNEVMHLDDVVNTAQFADIERQLSIIKCLRVIGTEIITFLASLEDFQKKLWLKKKFVVASEYCITLDRVDESLYAEIASNEKQWQQWEDLGFKPENNTGWEEVSYLTQHQFLMVDTSLFDQQFKAKLLQQIDDLDQQTDGLIIHSDNFQALNLLEDRYKNSVSGIHIDPPYNTDTSGFLYKNSYRHSSWMSMMFQTFESVKKLINEQSSFLCHIDENEYENLFILSSELGLGSAGTIIWDKKNPMLGRKGVATQHEYILCRSNYEKSIMIRNPNVKIILDFVRDLIENNHGKVDDKVRKKFSTWISKQNQFSGGDKAYKLIEEDGRVYRGVAMGAPELREDEKYHIPLIHPITNKPCPVPPNGWSRSPETLAELIKNDQILWGADETTQPQKKVYLTYETKKQLATLIQDAGSGKKSLDPLGLKFPYAHPVSMYNTLHSMVPENNVILDYFAGSATTAHSILDWYREYGEKREYILVEQGAYFESVIKPRIQKVVYASDWKDGKPLNPESGISHCLKVLKLESYEDTLNNLELVCSNQQQKLFEGAGQAQFDQYLMNYMLGIESKGSLLNVKDFLKPFDYQMNITTDSAGAYERRHVDLVETFNYLIGMYVDYADYQLEKGYVQISGHLRTGEYTTVLWRDCEKIGYQELDALLAKLKINPNDNEYQLIYINGDHNIANRYTTQDGQEKQLKVRSIEKEFLTRMFEGA